MRLPKFKVIFVDEAQDLSLIQWSIIEKLEKDTGCDVWVAGDDDQAIFGWAGADVDSFIYWKSREILLNKSERVPSIVQQKALGIINRIYYNRIQKDYLPKAEVGNIFERYKLSDIDLTEGDWLILTRTKALLKPIAPYLKRKGLFFSTAQGNSIGKSLYEDILSWDKLKRGEPIGEVQEQRIKERVSGDKDLTKEWYEAFNTGSLSQKEYMKAMLTNKENLSKDPRIKISTIHGAKGGEATNVVLFLDQTTNTIKGAKKSQAKQDEEFRVWYVGTTRTMQNLFVIKCKNKSKEFKL